MLQNQLFKGFILSALDPGKQGLKLVSNQLLDDSDPTFSA